MKITPNEEHDTRALSIHLPLDTYRSLRKIAVSNDLKNSDVVEWAMRLLETHVQEGGKI